MKNLLISIIFLVFCGNAYANFIYVSGAGKGTNRIIQEEVILVQGGVVNEDGDELTIDFNTYAHQGTAYVDSDWNLECDDGDGYDSYALTFVSGDDTKQWVFLTSTEIQKYWDCRLDWAGTTNGIERTDDDTIELAAFDDEDVNNFSLQDDREDPPTPPEEPEDIVIGGWVTEDGAGDKDGTSLANAWSREQINNPSICDTDLDADDKKIGSGETVYLSGAFTGDITNVCPGSAVNGQTVYDFYEDGDRARASNEAVGSTFQGTIYVDGSDYVCIQDGRFSSPSYNSWGVKNSIQIAYENNEKASNVSVKRCLFTLAAFENNGIYAGFAPGLKVIDNYYDGYMTDCYVGGVANYAGGMPVFLRTVSGQDVLISHNYIDGGQEGIFVGPRINRHINETTVDFPSSGSYTIDPEANMVNVEICHNYLADRCFEGFTLDGADGREYYQVVDNDVVASVDGNNVTLTSSGWVGKGNRWSGLYAGNICSRSADCNKWVLIESQNDEILTLSSALHIQPGDIITIGIVAKNQFWHHNYSTGNGFNGSTYLWEDTVYRSLFENNNTVANNYASEGCGLQIHSIKGLYQHSLGVTNRWSLSFNSYNVVQNNLLGDFWCQVLDHGNGDSYTVQNAVAFLNNDFHNAYYTRNEQYDYSNYYTSGSTNAGFVVATNSSAVSDTWSSAVISEIRDAFPPTITNVVVTTGSNYFDITFGESVTGNAACLAGGDCGIGFTDGSSPLSGIAYQSGSGTATWRFNYTGADPGATHQVTYDQSGGVEDSGGNEMRYFDYPMGHRGTTLQ